MNAMNNELAVNELGEEQGGRDPLLPAASRAPARLPTPAEEAAERLGVEPFGYAERS